MTHSSVVNKDNCSACRSLLTINVAAAHSFDSCFHLGWFWGRDFGDSVAYMQSSSLALDDCSQGAPISQAQVSHLQKCSYKLLKKKLRHKHINEFSLRQQSGSPSHSSSLVSYGRADRSEQLQKDHIRVKQSDRNPLVHPLPRFVPVQE